MNTKKLFWLFFLALTLFYLSLSPGAIYSQGYTGENAAAANQIISNLGDWLALRPAQTTINWPRHGLLELLFEIPLLLLAKLFFDPSSQWPDRMLSLQPVLMTAFLCTLIFVWVRRITSSFTWGYVLATIAALSTMLWPYAYIGLETTQSMFLLLSGYLALGSDHKRTWPHALLFGLSCGLAVSLKSNGIFLAPAVAFLCFIHARGQSADASWKRIDWKQTVAVVAIIAGLCVLGAYTRSLYPAWPLGRLNAFWRSSVGPLTVTFNAWSLLVSANKGLLVYCPVVILSLWALHKAYKRNASIVIFASLTLAGLCGGFSLLFNYADETWGPRYLHTAVAPLFICLALTRESVRFGLRREIPLVTLAVCGAAISFLGAFYHYGTLHLAVTQSGQATTETLQNDPNWNHIRFNLRLLRVWGRGGVDPVPWTPVRHWWFEPAPPDAVPLKSINLRDFATPQSALVRSWSVSTERTQKLSGVFYLLCLVSGSTILVWLGHLVLKKDRSSPDGISGGKQLEPQANGGDRVSAQS